ncbi:DMT family transporter [Paenibacillus chungangensis]|uniref:DMT family transporter n=1 Tax=Paenibacillus chungangensis TaxID=696535 RepID=A0ABW3HTB7_9BACL
MNQKFVIYLGLAFIAAVWGVNFGLARWAMDVFAPELFVFLRFGLTVPLIFLFLRWKEGSVGIALRDLWKLALYGFIGVTILEIAVMYSVKYTTIANASLLNVAPWPIFTALLAPLFTKEKVTRVLAIGGVLAVAGVTFIIVGGKEGFSFSSQYMWGNMIAIGISLLGAVYNLSYMSLMEKYSPLRVTAWITLFGVIFLLPFTWGTWSSVKWTELDVSVWAVLFYNVFFCTFLAFIIWNIGMKRIGASRANFYRYVVPASAAVTGYLMFGETVTLWQLLGVSLIAAGLLGITLERQPKEEGIPSKPAVIASMPKSVPKKS